jgi:hypothetical protein
MAWLSDKEFKKCQELKAKLEHLEISTREARSDNSPTVFFCGGWLAVELAEKILEEMTDNPKQGRPSNAGRPMGSYGRKDPK